ncbi:MAG: di-heme oxidoredictase family protein [Polyangiales bacterium]
MHPLARVVVLVGTALPACARAPVDPALTVVRDDPSDEPVAGATADDRRIFAAGDRLFERVFRPSQGLGPVFIQASCRGCHGDAGRGPGSVTRMVLVGDDGVRAVPDDAGLLPFGTTARPQFTAGATRPVLPPRVPDGVHLRVSARVGPAVFGRGWIEAVDDAAMLAQEAAQRAGADGVTGRVNRLADGRLGRLGVKARVADLDTFTADAFHGDMGLTSPRFPDEVPNPDGLVDDLRPGVDLTDETVRRTAGYVRRLAIPARRPADPRGRALFASVGCARCHTPALRTRADFAVRAMAGRDAEVYSDLLLHDMGAALADGVAGEGVATEREWRTAPLVGMRFARSLLHDGRARTVAEAVRAHGAADAESHTAARRFEGLAPADRAALLAFVEGL